jgi:hypothetical protein
LYSSSNAPQATHNKNFTYVQSDLVLLAKNETVLQDTIEKLEVKDNLEWKRMWEKLK